MNVPLWVRALTRTDRLAWNAFRGFQVVRDELLFAWLDPAQRDAVTLQSYQSKRAYLPGGETFERGLFEWEKKALARPEVPRAGRVLLAAAGGGRELKVLAERGYDVTAFEPNPVLRAGAQQVAAAHGTVVLDGVYTDLSAAVHGQGPLGALRTQAPFDLVVLGWGSLTHVLEDADRVALLQAIRTLAPSAPVLASYFLRAENADPGSRTSQLRSALRSGFGRLGARHASASPPGIAFHDRAGCFVYAFTERELRELAARSGYAVALLESYPYPHALFVPQVVATPLQ